jgi:hypothetical protein
MDATCFDDSERERSRRDTSVYYLDPWHRLKTGWLNPRIHNIGTGDIEFSLTPLQSGGSSLLVFDSNRYDLTRKSGEYFLFEYRNSTLGQYDQGVPNSGLIIWQITQLENGDLPDSGTAPTGNNTFAFPDVRGGNRAWVQSDGIINLKYTNRDRTDPNIEARIQARILSTTASSITIRVSPNR